MFKTSGTAGVTVHRVLHLASLFYAISVRGVILEFMAYSKMSKPLIRDFRDFCYFCTVGWSVFWKSKFIPNEVFFKYGICCILILEWIEFLEEVAMISFIHNESTF